MSHVIPRSRSCLLLALLSLMAFGGEAARGQITFSPQEIVEGDIVFLDYRTDETVSHWTWDFGDGSPPESGPVDESDGIITQHQYGTLGEYVVTLAADDKRCSGTLTVRQRGRCEGFPGNGRLHQDGRVRGPGAFHRQCHPGDPIQL